MAAYKDEKTGTYYVKFYYTDWTGKKKQKLKRGFTRKKDAQSWERLFLEELAKSPDITFEALYRKYIAFKENRVRKTTLQTQRDVLERHALPFFRDLVVSAITPAEVAAWQNELLSKGFSASFTRQINAYLRMVFKYAVDYLGLRQNPVNTQICKAEKGNIDFWTPEEYRIFSNHIKVNFPEKTISITKTLAYVKGAYIFQPPKTEKSKRIIDAPDFLLEELKAYIARIYDPQPDQRLFNRSRVWLGQAITYVCKELPELKSIRVHDLRHSHASVLINLGANPLMIAERLGHDDVKITMNIYAHLFQSHQKEIIEKLEKIKF